MLFCLSCTVYLGTVNGVADAYRLSGFPRNVVDFSFHIDSFGMFNCICSQMFSKHNGGIYTDLKYCDQQSKEFTKCHCPGEPCMMQKIFCSQNSGLMIWRCDMPSSISCGNDLKRLFGNVVVVLYYMGHGGISDFEDTYLLRALCINFVHKLHVILLLQ